MTQAHDELDNAKGCPAPRPKREDNSLGAHLSNLDDTPLFMRQLPEFGDEEHDSSALSALQSLTFEGTPDEVASGFKKQGNDYFVAKRFKEARSFYTQALDAYPTDEKLKETLLVNRAACNLSLENYGLVLKDCSTALGLNPASVKAFFRSAKALAELERFVEATDCCDHAILLTPSNAEVLSLRSQIEQRRLMAERKIAAQSETERRSRELKVALDRAFLARGLWITNTPKPPDNPHPVHFDPEALHGSPSSPTMPVIQAEGPKWRAPDPIRTPVVFPVVFLYPQHRQSDFVSHFHEDATFQAQMDAMFPKDASSSGALPWDAERQYFEGNLTLLAVTRAKRLLRIGKGLTLREAIDHCAREADKAKGLERDGLVLQDGLLSFVVVPKGKMEKDWIATFKQDRDRQHP